MKPSEVRIRRAEEHDLGRLQAVEESADRRFTEMFGAAGWPSTNGHFRASQPGFLLVCGSPAVGFIHVLDLDGQAHLDQVCVVRELQGRGIGSALLDAARRKAVDTGHDFLTLSTFADVPWNAPFYLRHGFRELTDADLRDRPHLAAIGERERTLRLDRFGRRIFLGIELGREPSPAEG